MRELKFRAWDKKTKKMRSVNSIAFNNRNSYGDFNPDNLPKVVTVWGVDIIECKSIILHREAKDVELMQYTGLKDKNGKEIYEGDIIEAWGRNTGKFRYRVAYEDARFVCYHLKEEYGRWGNLHRLFDTDFSHFHYEVIGNIYENPELIN